MVAVSAKIPRAVDGELVFGLVGNPVAIAGVVVGGRGRDIVDHGDGSSKAAGTAC